MFKQGRKLEEQLITAIDLCATLLLTHSVRLYSVFYKLNHGVGPPNGMMDKAPQVIFPGTAIKQGSPFLNFFLISMYLSQILSC